MKKSKLDNWVKRFSTGCLNKKVYKTLGAAKQMAKNVLKKNNVILHCYVCPDCFNYHLTKKNIKNWKNKIF